MLLDVLEELQGAVQLPAVDGLGGLSGVLERNAEVGTAGAGRLGALDLGGGVSNLRVEREPLLVLFFSFLSFIMLLTKNCRIAPCDNASSSSCLFSSLFPHSSLPLLLLRPPLCIDNSVGVFGRGRGEKKSSI